MATKSDALVIFGICGDLAYKKIFPALQALVRTNRLDVPVVGVSRTVWTTEQLVERVRKSVAEHGGAGSRRVSQAGVAAAIRGRRIRRPGDV